MRNKLIIIKFNNLFIGMHIEIYDDKNIWSNIFNNTCFFSNAEQFFELAYNYIYNLPVNSDL